MLAYLKIEDDSEKKDPKEYHCVVCGASLSDSDALFRVNGSHKHSFVNPSGVRCNFLTFSECRNILAHEELYKEHSWFPGYGWRFLLCQGCHQHLGWKWDSISGDAHPTGFYGLLLNAIRQENL